MNRYILWGLCLIAITGAAISYIFSQDFSRVLHSAERDQAAIEQALEQAAADAPELNQKQPYIRARTLSGSYLAGRFAQRHYDWKTANNFISQTLASNQNDPALLKRAMVLAMGAGEPEQAITLAKRVAGDESEESALTELFLAVGEFKNKRYQDANAHIEAMPKGGLTDFIMPMLSGWAKAGVGQNDTAALTSNSVHLYHAILIDDFMGERAEVQDMLTSALQSPNLMPEDLERIGDLYAHIGQKDKALTLYGEAFAAQPDNAELQAKIELFDKGQSEALFTRITSPEQGFAEALYDMARILAQDYSDESARVFLNMAIYLNPDLTKGKLLLAVLADRNDREDDAIAAYMSISADDPAYIEARRSAANIMDEQGRTDDALALLRDLANEFDDIESLIQIGDIYRMSDDFPQAITAYNAAEKALGGKIPAEYWHLAYVRGMAYEQNDQWDKAEKDLKLALSYQPSHPYILNYLGYAWADQDKNLDEALNLIEKAVTLEPNDGYIMDSLGWVLYRMENFDNAIPFLEQAVELMPYDATVNDHLGDAYWRVGRRMEARFQWERAKNHAEDNEALSETLGDKIVNGLPALPAPARSDLAQDTVKRKKNAL